MVQEIWYRVKSVSTTFHYTWKRYEQFVKSNQKICLYTVMNVYNSNWRFVHSLLMFPELSAFHLLRSLIMESPLLWLPKAMAQLKKQDPEHPFTDNIRIIWGNIWIKMQGQLIQIWPNSNHTVLMKHICIWFLSVFFQTLTLILAVAQYASNWLVCMMCHETMSEVLPFIFVLNGQNGQKNSC